MKITVHKIFLSFIILKTKELRLWHKQKFSNPYIFVTFGVNL